MHEDTLQALKECGFPLAPGGFGTVLLDPPWSFADKGSRAAPDWAAAPIYQTMSARSILDLPVDYLAAADAHCYLWTTDIHLPLALTCLAQWGFRMTKTLVWVKRASAVTPIRCEDSDEFQIMNGPMQIGMGHYYRTAHELCLFGVRGRAPARTHSLPTVFEAPRTQHSRKPDRVHEWAEALSPGPRLELFARRSRDGWEAWGDQFPGHDPYLRAIERVNAHRMEERAGLAKRRASKRAALRWESMIPGVSRWGGRCTECQTQIIAGDPIHYAPEESGQVCHVCYELWQHPIEVSPVGTEVVPF